MQSFSCNGSFTCLHGNDDNKCAKDDDNEGFACEVEESDPSGRYIRYKEVLGKGAFKTVYRGFDEIDGIEVAWNQINLQDVLRSPDDMERLCSEVHLLKTLKHKNIIKFYHSWVDMKSNRINFITEIFTSGTLRQYRRKHKHVDLNAVKNWCRQILRGLLYLHSHDPPIIHRDLKCDNIFINGNHGEVKIGDLGLAAILYHSHAAHSIIGTPEFMAPELYEEEYNELVDIYSFGMCLLEMVTFEYPYSECMNAAQIYKKVSSGVKPAVLDKLKDAELREFVEKCLATASKRLPARELLMDPFLRSEKDQPPSQLPCESTEKTGELDDFEALLHHSRSSLLEFGSSELKLASDASYDSSAVDEQLMSEGEDKLDDVLVEPMTFRQSKEEKVGRNMDFRLKGKRRENTIVYLRLRITAEGQVRIIHFPFDVDGDTALSVASEMVEELDLEDQDVIRIADMIDAAILVMVPEWKPGVAIDERIEGEENTSKHADNHHSSKTDVSTFSLDSSFIGVTRAGLPAPLHRENSIHGRFAEVTYHPRCQEHVHLIEEEQLSELTTSSEEARDWEPTGGSSSLGASPSSSFAKNGSGVDMLHKSPSSTLRPLDSWPPLDTGVGNDIRILDSPTRYGSDDDDNELLMQEIRVLTLRHEEELKDLQRKHQQALEDLKRQWYQMRAASSDSRRDKSNKSSMTSSEEGHDESNDWCDMQQLNKSFVGSNRRTAPSERLSFKELASLLAKVDTKDDPIPVKMVC